MKLEYRVPMELIEFVELVRDRLSWWEQSHFFGPRHISLREAFVTYTMHCFDSESGFFGNTDPPQLKSWVDNWINNAEFRWRDEVAETVGFRIDDDPAWEQWCKANMTGHNHECAFKYKYEGN